MSIKALKMLAPCGGSRALQLDITPPEWATVPYRAEYHEEMMSCPHCGHKHGGHRHIYWGRGKELVAICPNTKKEIVIVDYEPSEVPNGQ